MANTFVKIASVTVGAGGAANIQFTSIPSTYTDLLVKISARTNEPSTTYDIPQMVANGNQSVSYVWRGLLGNGESASTYSSSSVAGIVTGYFNTDANTANTFSSTEVYIPNYLSSVNKPISVESVTENGATTAYPFLLAGLIPVTAAITSLRFNLNFGIFKQYSTATLYGIKNS